MQKLPMMIWDAKNVHIGKFDRGVSIHATQESYEAFKESKSGWRCGMPEGLTVEVPDAVAEYIASQPNGLVYDANERNAWNVAQRIEAMLFAESAHG